MTQPDGSVTPPAAGHPLTADERRELERLRHERAALTSQGRTRRPLRWRSVFAVVLIALGCVLTPIAGLAVWTNNQLSDTERFVRSVGPLIDDPDVQNALTDRVTSTIVERIDVQAIADEGIEALVEQGLPARLGDRLLELTPTLASAVTGFVRERVADLVASDAVESAWDQAISVAHRQMNAVLSGESEAVVIRDGIVYLDLAPFVELAKDRLSEAGLTVVERIPEVHPTVELAQADTLVRAQTAYGTMDSVAGVLPWVVLLLLVAGVYLARNRFRALVGTGLGIALSMVVLALGLLVARGMLVDAVPARGAQAAASGFDIVVTYLRIGLRALVVLGLVLALFGFFAGGSDSASRARRWSADQLHRIRGGPAAGGPVAAWTRRHARALRIGAVSLAVLVFTFLDQPTGVAIVVIAAVLLLALAVIEFLARPEVPTTAEAPSAGVPPAQATPPATPPVEPIPAGSVPPVPTPAGPPPVESAPAESTGRS